MLENYIPGVGMLGIAVGMLGWLVRNLTQRIKVLERNNADNEKQHARLRLDNRVCEYRQSQMVIWLHQRGDPVPDFLFIEPDWAQKERSALDEET